MNFCLYTNSISPHQLPLVRELVYLLGAGNVLYAYEAAESKDRQSLGWKQMPEPWCRKASECLTDIETCDTLLVGGLRPIELMEKRATVGLRTLYMSERWFKPPIGMFRLLHPTYFNMARRLVRLIRNERSFRYLPIGIHAAHDMARLCGLFAGDLRCLFRAPALEFESNPGGRIWLKNEPQNSRNTRKYCLDRMRMWGYFVERGTGNRKQETGDLRVLWVGRLLKLKRVDTIIRALGELSRKRKVTLGIYGTGPEEPKLKELAAQYGEAIKFYPPVPIDEVRKLMCEHDVYVLSSNAHEGWGAVVSEALEEGMKVIGTYEAGSSATILPKECLFHAGDWKGLLKLLQTGVPNIGIGDWSAEFASKVLKV